MTTAGPTAGPGPAPVPGPALAPVLASRPWSGAVVPDAGQVRQVSWSLSAHARGLLTLALAGLLIAVLTGRPEFAGIAAPAVLLLAGWRIRRPGSVTVAVRVSARQLVEGERAAVIAEISGHGDLTVQASIRAAEAFSAGPPADYPAVTRAVAGDPASEPAAGEAATRDAATADPAVGGQAGAGAIDPAALDPAALDPAAGPTTAARPASASLRVPFQVHRWGIRRIGRLEIVLRDRFRLSEGRLSVELPRIDCHPLPAPLRGRIVLSRLPSRLGEHPSRALGEGIEFAGVRQFVPGDRQRRINWPATTRSGTVQLNTFTAERTQNVVIIADATANVGEPGATSLDLAFRAAAGTINCYLAAGDRVGLVVYGDRLSWIGPGLGRRHFHRLMDLLLASPRAQEQAAGLTRLPRAALPPGALIVVFSPLLHPRLVEALRDLRERGFSVLVVDVLTAGPARSRDRLANLARRIWRLEQQAIRFSLTELGIPVVHWDGQQSLDEPLAPYTRRVMLTGRT